MNYESKGNMVNYNILAILGHSKRDLSFPSTPIAERMRAGGVLCIMNLINWLMNLINFGHTYVNLQAWFAQLQTTCLEWPQTHC